MRKTVLRRTILLSWVLLLCACSVAPTGRHPDILNPPETVILRPTPATISAPSVIPQLETPVGIQATDRWIEIGLREQKVRLHDGERVVAEYLAATGVGDQPQTTTYPGVFKIQIMTKGPIESAPGVYVSDVLEFDLEHGNALHSLPMDKNGQILDRRLGQPVTAGCVRVAESAEVFDFAAPGMKVWVH